MNLVSNAIKFTHQGEVTVSYTTERVENEVLLKFEIQDTGIGMTNEEKAKLFKPFSQANSRILTFCS